VKQVPKTRRQIERWSVSKLFTAEQYYLLKEVTQKREREKEFPWTLPPLTKFPLKEVKKNNYKLTDVERVKRLIKHNAFSGYFCINKCINQLHFEKDEIKEAYKNVV
jgi:hypothetical protein